MYNMTNTFPYKTVGHFHPKWITQKLIVEKSTKTATVSTRDISAHVIFVLAYPVQGKYMFLICNIGKTAYFLWIWMITKPVKVSQCLTENTWSKNFLKMCIFKKKKKILEAESLRCQHNSHLQRWFTLSRGYHFDFHQLMYSEFATELSIQLSAI